MSVTRYVGIVVCGHAHFDQEKAAKDAGVKFAIDADAHAVPDLANLPYGIGTAQRGWLTCDDVINTWPLERLLDFFGKS